MLAIRIESKKDDETKVRDHCHLTGSCSGAAHKSFNLNVEKSQFSFNHIQFS